VAAWLPARPSSPQLPPQARTPATQSTPPRLLWVSTATPMFRFQLLLFLHNLHLSLGKSCCPPRAPHSHMSLLTCLGACRRALDVAP
jgi:hypothetical protein